MATTTNSTAPSYWARRALGDFDEAAETARLHALALQAIDGTMMSMVGDDRASRVVSAEGARQVWLMADIVASDESVLLTWRTVNGVEVARSMYLAIDKNLPAMLAAIAAVEVNA